MTQKPIAASDKMKGKKRLESLQKARRKVRPDGLYLIKRHGGWFRPGAHGYTRKLGEAGTFTGTEALTYLDAEGVSLWPLVTVRAAALEEIVEMSAEMAGLTALLKLAYEQRST
ncbi:hypothetical protein [Parvibaculum sp.]|uniref:hypothetical protein n=1 Tax=Parvibaculum sp. TaxID=2024848 RepID=UPI002735F9EA|nr:hypothetical protein [Parvibaculum sp.]MDP3328731.1 hypothetical protein [Parvibaculum sp.]